MGTITYKPVFALSPSLDDILGAPRRQVTFNDASLVYEVTGGAWAGCRIVYSGINLEYEDRNIPDPLSQVMQVNITWNSQILFGLSYPRVSLFDLLLSSDGVDNALTLLQGSTYGGANTFNGTDGADRLTAYRSGDTLNGGGGDDRFWGRIGNTILNGEAGNDTFVAAASGLAIHGSADDAQGLAETDTIEIHGLDIAFTAITNIDAVRFVSDGSFVNRSIVLNTGQIGDGLVSKTLHVNGSDSQDVANRIQIQRSGASLVNLDLSDWTFDASWTGAPFRIEILLDEGFTPFDDMITGTVENDLIRVGNGTNVLRGGLGADRLYTGLGDDLFLYGAGEAAPGELIDAGEGADTIEVRGDNDFSAMTIRGIERLRFAGDVKATLDAEIAPIEITGDGLVNHLLFTFSKAGRLDLSSWTFSDWSAADRLEIEGSSGNDEAVVKTGLRATMIGGGGNDTLTGADGDDWLEGGTGTDTLQGDDGIDTAVFSGRRADYVRTVDENGAVRLADQRANGDGTDLVSGVELFRFVDRTYTLAELLNNAPTGIALESGLILENSEPQVSAGTLSVVDDAGPHTYSLLSDAGGRFILDGDEIVYTGQGSLDYEQASSYRLRIKAEDPFGEAVEKDLVIVVGDVTRERATGTAQADTMWGGAGNDAFDGLAGNDLLKGGGGRDALTGGRGKDVFVFGNGDTGSSKTRADTILDFKGREGDRLDLRAVDANTKKSGDQNFSFIGTKAFSKAGEVRYEKAKSDTYVYLNADSDKAAEAVIKLKGSINLSKSWFIL